MFDAMRLIEKLPEMLAGEELIQEMSLHPAYEEELCRNGSDAQRLMKLSDLYNIYLPSGMSTEIYSKLYGKNYTAMDGTAVESAFALLLTKVTKPPYPAQISCCRIRHFYKRGR